MMRKEGNTWTEEQDMIEGWDELVEKMKGQRTDVTMENFMNRHFSADKYAALRRHIKAFVGGFDVADTSEVSVQSLYKEWSNESDQFRIKTGYGSLITYLEQQCSANGCKLYFNETVKQVDWQNNEVTIYNANGNKHQGSRLLVTVPVSVLKDVAGKASINFTPPIDEYIDASKKIGFGTVIKVIFGLKERLWEKGTGFIFSSAMIPTWWTQHPVENNIITGWAGGPAASRLAQHSDDELIEVAVRSMSEIFDFQPAELRTIITHSYVFNWSKYDEALGAYSFSTPHSGTARKILNTPLAETVFFAGEGLYEGAYSGTVEAALSSGDKAAAVMLKTFR